MTVRIWDNPRTISNLNCLFSMHNWKWMNWSKMADFNISLSLNEGKVAKSTTKAYVSFCLSLSAVVSPGLYRFLYRQWNKRNYSTTSTEIFFTFITRKTPGGTQQIFIWGGLATRSNLLIFLFHFSRKRYPFRILSIDKYYPFPIPYLVLCIPFAVNALFFK